MPLPTEPPPFRFRAADRCQSRPRAALSTSPPRARGSLAPRTLSRIAGPRCSRAPPPGRACRQALIRHHPSPRPPSARPMSRGPRARRERCTRAFGICTRAAPQSIPRRAVGKPVASHTTRPSTPRQPAAPSTAAGPGRGGRRTPGPGLAQHIRPGSPRLRQRPGRLTRTFWQAHMGGRGGAKRCRRADPSGRRPCRRRPPNSPQHAASSVIASAAAAAASVRRHRGHGAGGRRGGGGLCRLIRATASVAAPSRSGR